MPLSTHQILACVIAQWHAAQRLMPGCRTSVDPFLATLPKDFLSVPLTWAIAPDTVADAEALLANLPPSAATRAADVRARFDDDWAHVAELSASTRTQLWACISETDVAPDIALSDFLWGWLCTNSRCVYMDLQYVRHADNFTLAPLLDMANHAACPRRECRVRFSSRDGLELYAPAQPLQRGEEVYITYGAHSNSLLLAEYGFVLPRVVDTGEPGVWHGNRFCDVLLDTAVERLLDAQGKVGAWKRRILIEEGYSGCVQWRANASDYTLHPVPAPAHPSHRLHTALRLVCLTVALGDATPSHPASKANSTAMTAEPLKRPRTARVYTSEDALRVWRLVTRGGRECISAENENDVRVALMELCSAVQADHAVRRKSVPPGALGDILRQLLDEESEILAMVHAGASRGEEW